MKEKHIYSLIVFLTLLLISVFHMQKRSEGKPKIVFATEMLAPQ